MKNLNRLRQSITLLGMMGISAIAQAQNQPNTLTPIKHVIVIFQENVSFDHYFATYPFAANNTGNEPTFTAAPNTPPVNGLNGPLLTNNPNSAQPFRLTRAQAITCDQDHNYGDEQLGMNHGLMNKFVEALGVGSASCDIAGFGKKIVMGYYDGNTTTAMWNYAQNFAMSDNFYNTVFGPSTPGALNLISGQTHGVTLVRGSASGNVSAGSAIGDPRPDYDDCSAPFPNTITASGKNVGDLLNAKNITWGFFQGGFTPSSVKADGTAVCATIHTQYNGTASIADYIPHHQPFQYYQQTSNPHHLPASSVANIGQTDQANHQYDISDFFNALKTGNLPSVVYLKAPAYEDGHAGYSNPLDEQTFVVTAINAVMKSPFWSSTAIMITYDDSDGWYDHAVPPIVSPSNVPEDRFSDIGACGDGSGAPYQGRCGYGPRLPLLVISPYSKVNYVDHNVADQSSVLRFIEDNWGLGRIGDNSFDVLAGSLMPMFSFNGAGGASAVILDPATGNASSSGGSPGPGGGGTAITTAVANPKNATSPVRVFSLDGTKSTSFDGKPLTYSWTATAGSPAVYIQGANTATPSVEFGGGFGSYTIVLTVTDSSGATATDSTTVLYTGH